MRLLCALLSSLCIFHVSSGMNGNMRAQRARIIQQQLHDALLESFSTYCVYGEEVTERGDTIEAKGYLDEGGLMFENRVYVSLEGQINSKTGEIESFSELEAISSPSLKPWVIKTVEYTPLIGAAVGIGAIALLLRNNR